MPLRLAIPLLAALALPLAGCGNPPSSAEDFEGEERAVAEVVEDIQRAGERGEADRICADFLTKGLADRVGRRAGPDGNCTQELERAIEDADSFDLEVEDVAVTGTTATARVRGDAGSRDTVQTYRFVKGGQPARWQVEDFGST